MSFLLIFLIERFFPFRNVHFKIGNSGESTPVQNVTTFCRRNSPWPSQSLQKSLTPMTSQLFLAAPMTSSSSIHRDRSEPSLTTLHEPVHDSANFHRRSFSGLEKKSDLTVMAKSRSLNQSSFTITTNPLSASGQASRFYLRLDDEKLWTKATTSFARSHLKMITVHINR